MAGELCCCTFHRPRIVPPPPQQNRVSRNGRIFCCAWVWPHFVYFDVNFDLHRPQVRGGVSLLIARHFHEFHAAVIARWRSFSGRMMLGATFEGTTQRLYAPVFWLSPSCDTKLCLMCLRVVLRGTQRYSGLSTRARPLSSFPGVAPCPLERDPVQDVGTK